MSADALDWYPAEVTSADELDRLAALFSDGYTDLAISGLWPHVALCWLTDVPGLDEQFREFAKLTELVEDLKSGTKSWQEVYPDITAADRQWTAVEMAMQEADEARKLLIHGPEPTASTGGDDA